MDTIAARDKEPVYTTANIDRTFFLLDLHRLRSEGDTLENALVVYRPEADLKRVGPSGDAYDKIFYAHGYYMLEFIL